MRSSVRATARGRTTSSFKLAYKISFFPYVCGYLADSVSNLEVERYRGSVLRYYDYRLIYYQVQILDIQ